MKLRDLLENVEVLEMTADPELDIRDVAYDSRKVTTGALFVAITVTKHLFLLLEWIQPRVTPLETA